MPDHSFLVIAHDKNGAEELRAQNRDAHVAYLKQPHENVTIDVGGPLIANDHHSAGTFLVVAAPDRAAVEKFVANDPFSSAGIFSSVEIKDCKVTLRAK